MELGKQEIDSTLLLNAGEALLSEFGRWLKTPGEIDVFLQIVRATAITLAKGQKIIFFGNGGSAAEASHLAGEFVGKCESDIGAQSAISLTDSGPILTAIANDWNFDQIFARQIRAIGRPGDFLIGLSTSGTSKNVLNGLTQGKSMGMKTSLWTSQKFSGDSSSIDFLLVAQTKRTPRAQELHLFLGHVMCEYIERMYSSAE
jgi:D-sedoheptulose 7-phosphate isomerase